MESSLTRLGDGAPAADGLALLTVGEVAALLHLSGEAVRSKVRSGALPGSFRLGDGPQARYRIPSSAVANFMRDASDDRIERR